MMLRFKIDYLGKEFMIPLEVTEFVQYSNKYMPFHLMMLEPLRAYLNSKEKGFDVIDWRTVFTPIIQEIIQRLSEHSIYNITVSDFIENNIRFTRLLEINNECEEQARSILRKAYDNYMSQFQDAYSRATSRVTGTGTSVYTSDPLAYLVFANRESNEINRQIIQAKIEYNNAIERLNKDNSNWLDSQMSELRLKRYWPACMKAVDDFSKQVFKTIIESLNGAGVFNYNAICHYNIDRSTEILNNIDLVSDKKRVVLEAFSICPFNEMVFAKALEIGLIDNHFIETMETIGFKVSKEEMISACKRMGTTDNIKSVIESIANRFDIEIQDLTYEVLSERAQQIKDSYLEIDSLCYDDKELNAWISNHISANGKLFAETESNSIREEIKQFVLEKLPLDVLDQLLDNGIQLAEFEGCQISNTIQKNTEERMFDRLILYQGKVKSVVDSCMIKLEEIQSKITARKDRIRTISNEEKNYNTQKGELGLFALSEKRALAKRILDLQYEHDVVTKELVQLSIKKKALRKEMDSVLSLPTHIVKSKQKEEFEVKKFY